MVKAAIFVEKVSLVNRPLSKSLKPLRVTRTEKKYNLISVKHVSGLFSKKVYVTLDLPLEGISNTSVEDMLQKKLVVYAKKGFISSFPVHLEFLVKDPIQWQNKVMSSFKARIESLEDEKKRERVQIVFDFSALKAYMEHGGLMLQKVKCPECGAPIKLPQSGNQTTCEYCGSTILAQDIFEKIKNLV